MPRLIMSMILLGAACQILAACAGYDPTATSYRDREFSDYEYVDRNPAVPSEAYLDRRHVPPDRRPMPAVAWLPAGK